MPRYTDLPHPLHPHDCERCISLGTVAHVHGATPAGVAGEDLYACPTDDGDYDLVRRFGPGQDYTSLPYSAVTLLYYPNRVNGNARTELYVEARRRLVAHLKKSANSAELVNA